MGSTTPNYNLYKPDVGETGWGDDVNTSTDAVDTQIKVNEDAIALNTAKVTNVPTALSLGTIDGTTVSITSDGGADDVTLPEATTTDAGLLSAAKWDEIVANTAKVTNVPTALSLGTIDGTTVSITSDGGADDVTLPEATTTEAGLLSAAKWNEIVANTAKVTNVPTALSLGTIDATTVSITSDGGADDVTLAEADTTNAGLLGADKWDEIVASTAHISASGSSHSLVNASLVSTINFIIDGGGAAITTGIKGDIEIPFACTINQVTLLADQSATAVIDIWKDTYANFAPTVADTITAAAIPTITAAIKSQDATLTGWTTAITAGDILRFNVDSNDTAERITLSLKVTKT